jgi:hypothetical protein
VLEEALGRARAAEAESETAAGVARKEAEQARRAAEEQRAARESAAAAEKALRQALSEARASRTDWTHLVPPPVLTGHISSLLPY